MMKMLKQIINNSKSKAGAVAVFPPTRLFLLPLFLVAGFLVISPAQARIPAAENFVIEMTNEGIRILTTAQSSADREAQFDKLLSAKVDLRRMGRFALGSFVRKVSKQDFVTYQALLKTMIVKIYSNRLGNYSGEKIVIKDSQKKKRNVVVKSTIHFTNGREPIDIDWWLIAQKQGGYKLFDIRILGVWMMQEQRDVFLSVLKNNRGDFQALLNHLRKELTTNLAKNN